MSNVQNEPNGLPVAESMATTNGTASFTGPAVRTMPGFILPG